MGAGASAQEAVQGASVADMQAAIDQLPADDKEKLQNAWAAAQAAPAESMPAAPADGEAAAGEAAAAIAKSAAEVEAAAQPEIAAEEAATEAVAEGESTAQPEAAAKAAEATPAPEPATEGESAAKPDAEAKEEAAPYLAKYFDSAQARTAALIGDQEKLLALALDPDAQKKVKEESLVWFQEEAKPLLKDSFKHHDTKANDVLDKEEAAVFFQNMVREETDFAKAMSALSIQASLQMCMGMLGSLSKEEREEIKPQIEKQLAEAVDAAQAEVQKKEDSYKADRSAHNAAAFKVLDTNGDGTIQLSEFLAAFEPETDMNVEMHIALGFLTREDVEKQKQMEEQAKEEAKAASECTQQ